MMKLFGKKPQGDYFLIVGLGNPGKKYEKTRHNVGFEALDYIAEQANIRVVKSKFEALYGEGTISGQKVILLKPQTYMNLSGVALSRAASFYKIPPEKCVVLYDDVSLPVATLRIRKEGSAGGHNGMRSIIDEIGQVFPRVKIGVGEKPRPEYDLADWVLSRLTQDEQKKIAERFSDVYGAIQEIVQGDIAKAMNLYNGQQ